MRTLITALFGLLVAAGAPQIAAAQTAEDAHKQAAIVAAELGTIARHLQAKPEMALDFSKVSGEYCLNTWKAGGGHMTHFAIDLASTQEDVIDFVIADSLTQAGVDVASLPRFPGGLGTMKPNTWYYLPAGELEPHHGKPFPVPLLIRASNIQ
ncbi:MAG: hypothetical protein IIA01_07400 [Proteobacteria bacterium]|nr:hypothetical protein [Pseudomonadota bacterium]